MARANRWLLCAASCVLACGEPSDEGKGPGAPFDAGIIAVGLDAQGAGPSTSEAGAVISDAQIAVDAAGTVVPLRDASVAIDAARADAWTPPEAGSIDGPLNPGPVKFGKNIQVDDDGARAAQTEVVIAARPDGLVLAGFIDQRRGSRCGFSISRDGGQTWGKNFFAATQATTSGAFAGDPAVAIDDAGNLYAGCQDYASGGLGTNYILFAVSKDAGATWSEWRRIRQTLDKPWLGAASDGTVYVTWLGSPGGFMRSTDHGSTWADPISLGNINHGTGISTTKDGTIHVAYDVGNSRVNYRRSSDFGASLSPTRQISDQGTSCFDPCAPRSHPIVGNASDPSGKIVAVTWASRMSLPDAEGDDDVWVIVSEDGGSTFSTPLRVNDNTAASRQFQPWVAVDSYGAVHVLWTDMRNGGNLSTYYARMVDLKKGFESNVEVSDTRAATRGFLGDFKGITIQGRDVLAIWTDTRNGTTDIYFARASDAAAAGGPLAANP